MLTERACHQPQRAAPEILHFTTCDGPIFLPRIEFLRVYAPTSALNRMPNGLWSSDCKEARSQAMPVALEKTYHSRLQKGGALLDDMRALVRVWSDDRSVTDGNRRHAALTKATRARSHDTLIRSFLPRFVAGDPPGAWRLVRPLEDADGDLDILRPIYYWLTARSDRMLYDYVTDELCAIARSGDRRIRLAETLSWIKKRLRSSDHSIWSDSVTLRVGRGLLAALRDFGLLEGQVIKRLASFHLPLPAFCWIAFTLHTLGFTGTALANHPDWKLFLLSQMHVENLFLRAHQHGYLEYHAAGGIFRITFPASTHVDYANVILAR